MERYSLWILLNGDNRAMTWEEICRLEPETQADFATLSRIYNKHAKRWRKQREDEQRMKNSLKKPRR